MVVAADPSPKKLADSWINGGEIELTAEQFFGALLEFLLVVALVWLCVIETLELREEIRARGAMAGLVG